MATQYQVNINITVGTDFNQVFYLTNSDQSPMNITGHKFYANLGKHSGAIDAVLSTSQKPVFKYRSFETAVLDGVGGIFQIKMSRMQTKGLKEGKYVYDVAMVDANGQVSNAVMGLAFVDICMATFDGEELIFDGGSAQGATEHILDGGNARGFD